MRSRKNHESETSRGRKRIKNSFMRRYGRSKNEDCRMIQRSS